MTLIITVQSKNHIVIAADGKCRSKTPSNTLQKIFPLSNRGFAIAHHGQNIIEGREVKDIAKEFFSDNMSGIRIPSVRQIARLFVKRYGNDIRQTLETIPDSKSCGFLFLGFGMAMSKPKIYEAYWEKNILNKVVFEEKECKDLILSGDAQKYIKKYVDDSKDRELAQILKGRIQDATAYCDKLYQLAEEAQTKRNEDIFGGYKHQLVITKNRCEWLVPPASKEYA